MTSAKVALAGSYDYRLVALSVLIAIFASYASLDLAGRVTAARGRARGAWLAGGATAMGLGIWSMHYIGMLAFSLPIAVLYDWPTVLASMLAAIFASAIALYVVSRRKMDTLQAVAGSLIMGAGIATMHYTGMAAMRLAALCRWNAMLVILSVALAIVISLVALWLAFRFRKETDGAGWRKLASAVVMGAAIPVMHYTGMAAATFYPSDEVPDLSHAVSVSSLGAAGIILVTFMTLGLTLLSSLVDRRFAARGLELASIEERYRQLFERSLAGFYRITTDGHILDVNEAYSRIFGYRSREDHLRHNLAEDYFDSADESGFFGRLRQEKTVTNLERCLRRSDGAPVWVIENATLLENREGKPEVIEGTVIDITNRKQAEEELRESEEWTRTIIESANDAFVGMNAEGVITDWNRQAEIAFGWSRAEATGNTLASTIIPPQYREAHEQGLKHFLATGEGPVLNKRIEITALHRDGHEFPVELTISPIRRGEVYFFGAFIHDITERKRAGDELQRAKEAAEAASRAKSEFLAVMSHEIRTPMNGIMGMTELALDTELKPEQREYLTLVKESADTLLTLINDILDFSKIEAGKLGLDVTSFELDDTISHLVMALASRADPKGLELAYHIQPDTPTTLRGDPGRLRQIMLNLVGNAIKFTERGEVVVSVNKESATSDEVYLHFAVTDTGIGIPREKLQTIFEAFVQVDSSTTRKYGGTGLGLTISRRLVELMGGRIWVESELGKGSTFHFTSRFVLDKASPARRPPAEAVRLRDLHVLVVDDNATNRRILEAMLKHWQMQPTLAESGEAGLKIMESAKAAGKAFPLILLDSQMPDMDGFIVAERIKQDPALAGATIMMLTSAGQRGDAARCRKLGIAAYLIKPIRHWEMLEAILAALGMASRKDAQAPLITRHWLRETRPRLHVLLAEDNPVNRELAVRLLEKRGHTVVAANNGKEALAALERQAFDLVLMDVQMPEMDGFEATAAIRAKEILTGTHLPIVALTAHAMKSDRERCLAAGMDGYVTKPIQAQELFETIESLLHLPAEAETAASAEPLPGEVLDRAAALARVDGDVELLRELARLFLADYPRLWAEIHQAVANRDIQTLGRAAHTLKGSVGNFGARDAFEAARRLEMMAREGELSHAEEACVALGQAMGRLKSVLTGLATEATR